MTLTSVQAHVRAIARARSLHRALRKLAADSTPGLLILPTSVGAIELAQALCARQPCRITTGSVVAEARWALEPHLRTPAEIVREFAGERRLAAWIISFPDQVAGEGESFVTLRFLGLEKRFSLLEAVLALRHQPRVYQFRSRRPLGAYRLLEVAYSDALSAANHRTAPVRLLQTLLAGFESELATPPADWLGAASFALKSPITFEFRVREELKEIESLLRLAVEVRVEERPRLLPALNSVAARIRGTTQ